MATQTNHYISQTPIWPRGYKLEQCVQLLRSCLKGQGHALCHPRILPDGWNVNTMAGTHAATLDHEVGTMC